MRGTETTLAVPRGVPAAARPLPAEVGDASSLSGGAVLSNGEIALIVDCDALADACGAATASSTDLPNAA